MNSAFWMNDPHNINVVHCKICGITIYKVTAGESVGMRRHVKLKHSYISEKELANPDINIISAINNRESYTTNPKRNSKERQQKVIIHLASFCSIEAILPTFLNTEIFMQFCYVALDDLLPLIPSSELLVNELANISGRIRENIINELNTTCEFCSLSFQCYTLKCQLTVLQISCRWIDNNLDVRNVVLGCKLYVPVENKTNDLSGLIKDILLPYNTLLPKIISIITQSSEDLTGSISLLFNDKYFSENVTVVVCFADCLDKELNNFLINYYNNENLSMESKEFLYNLFYIISVYDGDMTLVNTWVNDNQLPMLLLGKSRKWYYLCQTLTAILCNWNAFSDLMKGSIEADIYDSFFNENTYVMMEEVYKTLLALAEIVDLLSADKTPLPLGSVYPYLRICANLFLYDEGTDLPKGKTKIAIELREQIIRTFAQPWSKTPNKLILGGCTLDPSFNYMSLFDEEEAALIDKYLIDEIKIIQQIHKLDFEESYMNDDEDEDSSYVNNNQYTMNYTILEDLEQHRKKREKKMKLKMRDPEEILEEYRSLPLNLVEHEKVYNFWKCYKNDFKELVYLFKKCCCLPATAAPRGELFVPERLPFYVKRDLLDSDLAECCIMIRSNMNEIDFLRDTWPSVLLDQ